MELDFITVAKILYLLVVVGIVVKIIVDTDNSAKATAYILLIIILPLAGIFIYLSFGINYRKRKLYSKKLKLDEDQSKKVSEFVKAYQSKQLKILKKDHPAFFNLSRMFSENDINFATNKNAVKLLINGENKFPELLRSLQSAEHHIHIAYYIYENDSIGNQIADILIEKAKQGVEVRFIYDDFGSYRIRKTIVPKLRANGVKAIPFYKIKFIYLANRLNYRNHRKIVIVDGETAFVGGINVSDKYVNNTEKGTAKEPLFWRDTHLKITGEGVWSLQNIFFADWGFCTGEQLLPNTSYFQNHKAVKSHQWTQVVSSGPDSNDPNILFSYLSAIYNSTDEIFITTPYFAPGNEFMSALKMAAMRGVKVMLLVPGISDSYIVNAVSKSNYKTLLQSGVDVYLYQKGFVHAKTMVCDEELSVVGTANLDGRSFDLNFEVNALVYDSAIAKELKSAFLNDLNHADKLDLESWQNRPRMERLTEKVLRLAAPLM